VKPVTGEKKEKKCPICGK